MQRLKTWSAAAAVILLAAVALATVLSHDPSWSGTFDDGNGHAGDWWTWDSPPDKGIVTAEDTDGDGVNDKYRSWTYHSSHPGPCDWYFRDVADPPPGSGTTRYWLIVCKSGST